MRTFVLQDGGFSFPLYAEAIRFFHHEESMVRIAVRTLTLTIYHGVYGTSPSASARVCKEPHFYHPLQCVCCHTCMIHHAA